VLAQNNDDHTKNFSFVLDGPDARWRLAPAYDVTYAYNPTGDWTYQHLMSVNGRFTAITRSDLLEVADRQRVPRAKAVIAEVEDAIERWPEFAEQAGVEKTRAADIRSSLPLRRAV
jgi:serine/threonine-protein kinase HipA